MSMTLVMYVRIFILRICAQRRRCLNEAFLVKIVNYYSFCSSGEVSGIRGKQMTPAVASERNIFSKNHDYNSYIKIFPVNTYVPTFRVLDARGDRKLRTGTHTHTHTHTRDSHSDDTIKII